MRQEGKFIVLEGLPSSGKTTQLSGIVEFLKENGIAAIPNAEPTKRSGDPAKPAGNIFGFVIRELIESRKISNEVFLELGVKAHALVSKIYNEAKLRGEVARSGAVRFSRKLLEILKKIRSGKRLTELEFQLLYIADRFWDLEEVINPIVKTGVWAVNDRYDQGTGAYGASRGLKIPIIYLWQSCALFENYRWPDLTLFFKVGPGVAAERLVVSGKVRDRFEKMENLLKISKKYREVFAYLNKISERTRGKPLLVAAIDGNLLEEEVSREVKKAIKTHLLKK